MNSIAQFFNFASTAPHSWAFIVRTGLYDLVVEPSTRSREAWLLIAQSLFFFSHHACRCRLRCGAQGS